MRKEFRLRRSASTVAASCRCYGSSTPPAGNPQAHRAQKEPHGMSGVSCRSLHAGFHVSYRSLQHILLHAVWPGPVRWVMQLAGWAAQPGPGSPLNCLSESRVYMGLPDCPETTSKPAKRVREKGMPLRQGARSQQVLSANDNYRSTATKGPGSRALAHIMHQQSAKTPLAPCTVLRTVKQLAITKLQTFRTHLLPCRGTRCTRPAGWTPRAATA